MPLGFQRERANIIGKDLEVALPLRYIIQNALKLKNPQSAAIWFPEIYNL